MFLRIKSNKVKYIVNMLNSEAILIKIENIKSINNIMTVSTAVYIESDYIANGKKAERGHLRGINNNFVFNTSETGIKHYSTNALELIKEAVKAAYELSDTDFEKLADIEWEDKETYPIRLTFPTEEVWKNYGALVDTQKDKPRVDTIDGVTIYVSEILDEHNFIRDNDNLLIEE